MIIASKMDPITDWFIICEALAEIGVLCLLVYGF
jgi:hypothetical protein